MRHEREREAEGTTHADVVEVADVVVGIIRVIRRDKQCREQKKNSRECCREKHEKKRSV
jgi:hypothetical protein